MLQNNVGNVVIFISQIHQIRTFIDDSVNIGAVFNQFLCQFGILLLNGNIQGGFLLPVDLLKIKSVLMQNFRKFRSQIVFHDMGQQVFAVRIKAVDVGFLLQKGGKLLSVIIV